MQASPGATDCFANLDSECRQNTHSHDTFVHVQLITERSAQAQSLTTRTRVAQVVCLGVSKVVCHPSVMSHMLPHLSQNTSTRSLSPTFRRSSRSLSCFSELDQETLRDPRRSGGKTKSACSTGYEPKMTQSDGSKN